LADACPKVSKSHIEQLRAAGALGALPDTSRFLCLREVGN
jgi:hypothetical protein